MTENRHGIGEIDLQALADGLLDGDPRRRAAVEEYLRERPAEAARVAEYASQNEEIRALYNHVLAQTVPERLETALEGRRGQMRLRLARGAVAASLLMASGFTGWWLGQVTQPEGSAHSFSQMAMTSMVQNGAPFKGVSMAGNGDAQPMNWLSDKITLELQAPDLGPLGFTLADKRLVTTNGQQAVQLTYAGNEGARVNLFLRTRWREETPELHFTEQDGVGMAYWLDGPLGYGITGSLKRQDMLTLANAVREAMHVQPEERAPQIQVDSGVASEGDVGRPPEPATPILPARSSAETGRM